MAEQNQNDIELEQILEHLVVDARLQEPRKVLEFVRTRLEADICYLVLDIGYQKENTVRPGFVATRTGGTNSYPWHAPNSLSSRYDDQMVPGVVKRFSGEILAWLWPWMDQEEAAIRALSGKIVALDTIGLFDGNTLIGVLCAGYTVDRPTPPARAAFLPRLALWLQVPIAKANLHRELTMTQREAAFKNEIIAFMRAHPLYADVREFVGTNLLEQTGAQHVLLIDVDGARSDWHSADAPQVCRDCVAGTNRADLIAETFPEGLEHRVIQDIRTERLQNLPCGCPKKSSVMTQFKRGNGAWRIVVDFMSFVNDELFGMPRALRAALELLSLAYDREHQEQMIARQVEDVRSLNARLVVERDQQRTINTCLATIAGHLREGVSSLEDVLDETASIIAAGAEYFHAVGGNILKFGDSVATMMGAAGYPSCTPGELRRMRTDKIPVDNTYWYDWLRELDEKGVILRTGFRSSGRQFALWNDVMDREGIGSFSAVKLMLNGELWGEFVLHFTDDAKVFTNDDLKMLANFQHMIETMLLKRHFIDSLTAERDRVVEAEKAKTLFFSSISHDIRTPLNAILGFSELLEGGALPPDEAKRALGMITTSGKTLLHLVNDILDLSKLEAGKMEIVPEPTDVRALVAEILPVFGPQLGARHQTLVSEVPELPPLMVDPHRIRQVLFNLIGNAVKYAGPCTIRVVASYMGGPRSVAAADAPVGGVFTLTVSDDGAGMTDEQAGKVMEPYTQAHAADRKYGTGLGLSICRQLAQRMEGSFTLKTAPGAGCQFTLTVPGVAQAGERGTGNGERNVGNGERVMDNGKGQRMTDFRSPFPDSHSPRILVADDAMMNRTMLKSMLASLDITDVTLVEDGQQALDALKESPDYDWVLTDMWMPGMDGLELVKSIRTNEKLAGLRVCTITGDAEARNTYRDQGFDALLLKPIKLAALRELLGTAPQARPVESQPPQQMNDRRFERQRVNEQFRNAAVAFMASHTDYAEVEKYICEQLVAITGIQHLVLFPKKGWHVDYFGPNVLAHCRQCAYETRRRVMDFSLFGEAPETIMPQGAAAAGLNRPAGCPVVASIFRQLRRSDGSLWRVIADFTTPPTDDLKTVSTSIGLGLELIGIAYERAEMREQERRLNATIEENARLLAEREREIAAEKAKAAFFASVSHDIRTPLNAILGFTELLKAGDISPEERRKDLDQIESSGKTLLGLVNDLMGLSQTDAEPQVTPPEPPSAGTTEAKTAAPSGAREGTKPTRILVVDDSAVHRKVLTRMLKKVGVEGEVVLADNGVQALNALEKDTAVDFVLTDLWMPEMDGWELIRRIRGDARFAHLFVGAVTADVTAQETYREQGFDALILKPVTLDKVRDLLARG